MSLHNLHNKVSDLVWINGEPVSAIAVTNRGLLYGDGLFETILVIAGKLSMENLHWDRMSVDAFRLGIDIDIEQMKRETHQFLHAADAEDVVLKVMLTRGSGGRGYNPSGCINPCRILSLHPLPSYPSWLPNKGIVARLCNLRLGYSCLAGVKHLNRLEQVLARNEWSDPQCYEGLLMDYEGFVIEGTMTNLFLVDHDGLLLTPKLDNSGVAGVCRQYILEQAGAWGLSVQERRISLTEFTAAKEVFVCNSVNGVWPVAACGTSRWPVGVVTCTVRDRVVDVLNA
ncbi:MAG: aminodeoxychorismate lyase [Candidatus Endonucleobacter bathymodioli]|uniref:Aminodeoxychorismate lyase n=1 Tax=Candidatus Endonucleibacter bathymodioli TaxID=539814 RepID=A0AA90NJA2_9GAMM|nr:aminodeoxychorismate lyase [Candidatus Endonucleobacter bathymodioli]